MTTPLKMKGNAENSKNHKILSSAAVSASFNMLYQFLFRILTFVLNAITIRFITKEMLGVVNVRLNLLHVTILFMSREAFRRACLSKRAENPWPQVINLLWCTFPIGVVCSVLFSLLWLYVLESPDEDIVAYYGIGVMSFAFAAVVELIAEPLWVAFHILLHVKSRVVIEGCSQAVRCILSICLIMLFPQWGIIAFSIAQVCCCLTFTILFYAYFFKLLSAKKSDDFPFTSVSDVLPKKLETHKVESWIDWSLAKLTWSFLTQSFLKQILTDGERYVMTIFGVLSFADQGIYDVINNLGSLAARFVFLPIEESAYFLFSQTLERGVIAKQQAQDSLKLATEVLQTLLKAVTLIGCIILVFGNAYSYLLLDIYGGHILSSGSGPSLLRHYCVYVLLLAVNGVSEGFVFATMSKQEVDRYNKKMLVFSVVFLSSAYCFTSLLGSIGFILANCLNMSVRILHSVYYIVKFYKYSGHTPLSGLLPNSFVIASLTVSYLVTSASEVSFCCTYGLIWKVVHIICGAACLLIVLVNIYVKETKMINFIQQKYLSIRKNRSQ